MTNTITKRRAKDKQKLIDKLKQMPIIQVASQQSGIGRATYYRWRKEDKSFAKLADQAINEGRVLINELSESKLISAIQDQNMTAIIFWLKKNNSRYADKVELTHKLDKKIESLSKEQEKTLNNSLLLAGLLPKGNQDDKQE